MSPGSAAPAPPVEGALGREAAGAGARGGSAPGPGPASSAAGAERGRRRRAKRGGDGHIDPNVVGVARGGSILFAGKLFTYLSRFVITVLLARLLGEDQYGLFNLSLTVAAIVASVALLGLDSGLIRYIALFVARGDRQGIKGVLAFGIGVPTALSAILTLFLVVAAPTIANDVFHDARLTDLLRLGALTIPFLTLMHQFDAALRGFKRMGAAVFALHFVQPTLRIVLVLPLVVVGLTTSLAIGAYIVTIAIVSLLMLWSLNRAFAFRSAIKGRHDVRDVAAFSLPVYLSNLLGAVGDNIQTVMLGALSTVATVGIFAVAFQLTLIGKIFHNAVTVASMPLIAEIHDTGDRRRLGQFFQTTTKWTTTFNLPFLLMLLLFPTQLLSLFGRGFEAGAGALVVLAMSNLAIFATGPVGAIIDMTGNTKLKLANTMGLVVLSVGMNALLIPTWGVLGAAVSMLTANAVINAVRLLEVYLLLGLHPYSRQFIKPLLAAAAAAGAALLVVAFTPDAQPAMEAVIGSVTIVVVFVVAIAALGISAEDRALLGRVRARLPLLGTR